MDIKKYFKKTSADTSDDTIFRNKVIELATELNYSNEFIKLLKASSITTVAGAYLTLLHQKKNPEKL